MSVPTQKVTIYRRSESADDLATFFERLANDFMEKTVANDFVEIKIEGAPAQLLLWQQPSVSGAWVEAVTHLAGPLAAEYTTRDCGALLWIEVDGITYVIGFGDGWRAIPDDFKDHGFGLGFTIRAVDADEVRGVVRRSMSGLGRQDVTRVPRGIPIGHVGLSEYGELVRSLAGKIDPADLGLADNRAMTVEGSSGLQVRIPLHGEKLVALLRRISEICARKVRDEFTFIEAIVPVRDKERRATLDEHFNKYVRSTLEDEDIDMRLAPAVPLELTGLIDEAQSIVVRFGRRESPYRKEHDLETLLAHLHRGNKLPSIQSLRRGEVHLYEDTTAKHSIAKASADRWLAASTRFGDRDYFLIEGNWYEGGAQYHNSIQRQIAGLFKDTPSLPLPTWPQHLTPPPGSKERGEALYNRRVEKILGAGSVLNMDRAMVPSPFHGKNGFEACDLLGPDNELIHVKGGKGTDPFSHLFNQALISTEALYLYPEARDKFEELVHDVSSGKRSLPPNWRPEKVIFAITVKRKTPLTARTLFPHAQIALARMSSILKATYNVDVEVIAITWEPGKRAAT